MLAGTTRKGQHAPNGNLKVDFMWRADLSAILLLSRFHLPDKVSLVVVPLEHWGTQACRRKSPCSSLWDADCAMQVQGHSHIYQKGERKKSSHKNELKRVVEEGKIEEETRKHRLSNWKKPASWKAEEICYHLDIHTAVENAPSFVFWIGCQEAQSCFWMLISSVHR